MRGWESLCARHKNGGREEKGDRVQDEEEGDMEEKEDNEAEEDEDKR